MIIMRTTTFITVLGAAALAVLTGCTVKDVDQPAVAGPSTFFHSIIMVAERDTLTQNGVDFTDIRITSLGPGGQSETVPLRAQVYVDGIPQDFGTLSTKTPTTPTTIRYTAPPGSALAGAQVPTTVTIAVTPSHLGDFRGEFTRQIDIQLLPQGIILPSNPFLVPEFAVSGTLQAFQTVTFDASPTTNNGAPCPTACSYSWSFGDGTSGSGVQTTHVYRTAGTFAVTLTVTDARGASASTTRAVVIATATPPTAAMTISPSPAPANVDIFFDGSASRPAGGGRVITEYRWNFGDGSTGSGITTTHRFSGPGTYQVTLTVVDDAGSMGTQTTQLSVAFGGQGTVPIAVLTATPSGGPVGQRIVFDASASTPSTGSQIFNYRFDFGDGTPAEDSSNPIQSHVYGTAGTFIATVTITDGNNKTATRTLSITITP
jgi:PKD repeat protein